MKRKLLIGTLLLLIVIPSTTGLLGTFAKNNNIDLIQTCNNCTYCNLTAVKYPNGTNIVVNVTMDKAATYFNYTLNTSQTDAVGTYKYCYECGNDAESATGCIDFDVTLSGTKSPEGQSFLLSTIILITFGVACLFLFLSGKMQESGPKIFFLLASFVFIVGTVIIASVVAFDSNLTSGVNNSVSVLVRAIGIIVIVIFAYIMIKQIKEALDMMGTNKGYEMGY